MRIYIFCSILCAMMISSCATSKKDTLIASNDISDLVSNCKNKVLRLDKNSIYYIDEVVTLPEGFTIKGNGAKIKVQPQKKRIQAAFLINGNDVHIDSINMESSSLYTMIGHENKSLTNPLASNIYAFVSNKPFENFSLTNSQFKDVSIVVKLSDMQGLVLQNVYAENIQNTVYCQYCTDVEIENLNSNRSTATNRFTHHLYFNSVKNLIVKNSKLINGAGKAINIKVDDKNYPSSNVKIQEVELDSTGGIFLTFVDDVLVEKLKSNRTKHFLICSSGVGDVRIVDSFISCLDRRGPTISALDVKSPVEKLYVYNTTFEGPINIEGHTMIDFTIDSCNFSNFFYQKTKLRQVVFYMKENLYQGKFTIKNSRFYQSYSNPQSFFIRNDANNNFYFENNFVEFTFPQKELIFSGKNSTSFICCNKMIGVKKVTNIIETVKTKY